MRRALLIGAVALAGCGGGQAPQPGEPGELEIRRSELRPGQIGLEVHNDSAEPALLAQVAIDDGFVDFMGPSAPLAPHTSARLTIPYPWVQGSDYEVKVITGDGGALEYEVEAEE